MSSTTEALKRILGKVKSDPTLFVRLPETAHLIDDVGLDSIEMLQLMLEIESELPVHIDFDRLEYAYLSSIQTLAAFLDGMPARPISAK